MTKKIKLIEKFYVEQHMDTLTPKDISKALGWDVDTVTRYIAFLKKKGGSVSKEGTGRGAENSGDAAIPPSVSSVSVPTISSANLIAKYKKRGFVAMTSAASEVGDEIRKQHGNPGITNGLKEFIHRPFGNEE